MIVRTNAGFVGEVDRGSFFLRSLLDRWIFLFLPALGRNRVLLIGAAKRLLRAQAELAQQAPDRNDAEQAPEYAANQHAHHLPSPERELETELPRIVVGDDVEKPPELLAIELRLAFRALSKPERFDAAFAISGDLVVDAGSVKSQRLGDVFGTHSGFAAEHGSDPDFLPGLLRKLSFIHDEGVLDVG